MNKNQTWRDKKQKLHPWFPWGRCSLTTLLRLAKLKKPSHVFIYYLLFYFLLVSYVVNTAMTPILLVFRPNVQRWTLFLFQSGIAVVFLTSEAVVASVEMVQSIQQNRVERNGVEKGTKNTSNTKECCPRRNEIPWHCKHASYTFFIRLKTGIYICPSDDDWNFSKALDQRFVFLANSNNASLIFHEFHLDETRPNCFVFVVRLSIKWNARNLLQ